MKYMQFGNNFTSHESRHYAIRLILFLFKKKSVPNCKAKHSNPALFNLFAIAAAAAAAAAGDLTFRSSSIHRHAIT